MKEISRQEIIEIEEFISFIEERMETATNVIQYYSWDSPNKIIVCVMYEFPLLSEELLKSWLNELGRRQGK